jgi:hypothetical protein
VNELTFATIGAARLDRQHARISREFILGGGLARLYNECRQAVSLLPTVGVVAWHGGHGGNIDLDYIRALGGVTRRGLVDGLHALDERGFVRLREIRSTTVNIEWLPGRAGHLNDRVFFPGHIIGNGVWSELSAAQHSILLALLGILHWRVYEEDWQWDEDAWNVFDYLSLLDLRDHEVRLAMDRIEDLPHSVQLPLARLADIAGVSLSSASRAIGTLREDFGDALVTVTVADARGAAWYHLPRDTWGP